MTLRLPMFPTRTPARSLVLALPLLLLAACLSVPLDMLGKTQPYTETELRPAAHGGRAKLVLLPVDGVISAEGQQGFLSSSEGLLAALDEALDKAAKDDRVAAVILRIDSPGGEVTACDVLAERLRAFRRDTGKPVVAALVGLAASGGYYLACATDRVVAHPTCVVGSIGVISQMLKVQGLAEKLGLEMVTIKSGRVKDIGNPFRDMTDEERAIFQAVIDSMYERFVQVVAVGRGMAPDTVRPLAEGQVYAASRALELGLIDEIGYLDAAEAAARKLAGVDDASLVVYHRRNDYMPTAYARAAGPAPQPQMGLGAELAGGALEELLRTGRPGFYYLWAPGR